MITRARARSLRLPMAVLVACALLITILEIAPTEAGAANGPAAGRLSLAALGAKASVRYGERLNLNGRVPSGTSGGSVRLEYAPRGRHLAASVRHPDRSGGHLPVLPEAAELGRVPRDLRRGHLGCSRGHRAWRASADGPTGTSMPAPR